MILDATLRLEVVLDAAKTTNDMDIHVDYIDWNAQGVPSSPATKRTASNGSSDVTILDAPTVQNVRREPIRIAIYNRDTANKTMTLKTDDGTTERIIWVASLTTVKATLWEKGTQWQFNV